MSAIQQLAPHVGQAAACRALALPRAPWYRRLQPVALPAARPTPARALPPAERQTVLQHLHSERFRDKAPAEVFATLLDEGVFLCWLSTMYRILAADGEVRERRDQLRHPQYKKPELLATAPNQVWSWDITKLLGPAKWTYYYLYVILDIFSRYVVGWMVADGESAQLAQRLIADTCQKQLILPGQLNLHADRGTSMTSKPVAFLLADLGVTKTHSRPHVSDDNPTRKVSSRPSSTAPSSLIVSGPSRMRGRSVSRSFAGITTSTITAASPCSPPTCFTMGGRRRSSSNDSKFSTTLMLATPNDSCGPAPNPAATNGGLDQPAAILPARAGYARQPVIGR